jgi:hypothetical protein
MSDIAKRIYEKYQRWGYNIPEICCQNGLNMYYGDDDALVMFNLGNLLAQGKIDNELALQVREELVRLNNSRIPRGPIH